MSVSVSIIIPIYNVEQYLPECLESALCQTLPGIEIICLDDGSTDHSLAILEAYAAQNSNIHVIQHERNLGLAYTRNAGLDIAMGHYIFFLDSDDSLLADSSIQHLYDIATSVDSDEVIGGVLTYSEETGTTTTNYHKNYLKRELRGVTHSAFLYLFDNVVSCNKLIKKDFLLQNNIRFDPHLKKYEDNPFSCMVHVMAKSISLTTKPTYLHRIRQDSDNQSITQEFNNDHIWHIHAAKNTLDFLYFQKADIYVLHLHQFRLLSWLNMDIQQNRKAMFMIKEEEIFKSYYKFLDSINSDTQYSMQRDALNLLESLRYKDYNFAKEIIYYALK